MKTPQRDASRIETLRIAVGPGASTMTQLATAITKRRGPRAARISVAGFFFPYLLGFPVLAYPCRKPLAPVYARRCR